MLLQYDQNASWDDLEESIQLHRRALSLRPFGHRERATSLSNLANSLLSRYKHQGDVKDLDEAIDYYQDALLIIPKNDPIRPLALSNVANGLESRYGYHGRQSDLKEAIGTLREALSLSPPGHVSRFMQASNLASCLGTLYEKDKRLEVLQESIKYHREALSLCSASNPERGRLRVNLAEMLVDEYRETKDMKPLDEAVDFLRQALEDSPSYHPQVADILSVTASAYLAYPTPRESHSISKVDEAFALLQKAASHPTGGIRLRFRKSFKWATLASSHKHNSRLEAYRSCLELLDQYVLTRTSVISRHQHLSDVIPTAVASDAASNAIEMGKLETAVEFLEQGKTILWSQLGRYRTPLDELHKVDKELAMEFERLSLQLETAVVSRGPQRRIGASLEEEARAYKRLSDEWDRLVERIRKLDGFQSFLKAIPFGVVKQASIVGPIIVVNVSETRSDAIIVRYGRPLSHIPLPSMTLEDADRLSLLFSRALATGTEQVRKRKVLMILRMLWSDVVKPIVDHLRSSGVELGSRIWWCVTSKLSSLPIHAAGPHKGNEPNLPDLFVSSYTPTLLALLKSSTPPSSKQSDSKSTTPSLLLVAQPATPGQQQIQSVRDELDIVKSIIPSLDILGNNQGIRDDVLNGLRTHRWVHFASHGSQDLGEPFNARFHLYDKPLTLLDIIQARLPQAEFAFLSACHSAAGDKNTPDETIHLAAGLQFSGFKSVIGTMWRMADIDGPVVAEEVYKYLFRRTGARGEGGLVDYRDAAVALNIARKVLQRRGVPIDRWINFVHIGM
ncbi:hypothetical protein FRC03_002867 [Tulasnella sp. 419]|nr:hypothetical protein FRC03_002867 [Tulasnella sp. 419]